MQSEFVKALKSYQTDFGVDLSEVVLERLEKYHDLILEHNTLLHLVAPCSPQEFATRHILESLTLLKHLPTNAKFVDVGSGGGFPAIPCLIARDDLAARLIESKEKKAAFLDKAIANFGLADRCEVVAKQFSETNAGDAEFVTCRALDRFNERLARLIRWSGERRLLLFGGEETGRLLDDYRIKASRELMPLSERRYLYISHR